VALLVAGIGVSICTVAFLRIPLDATEGDSPGVDRPGVDAAPEHPGRAERIWTHPPDEVSAQVEGLPGVAPS